MAKALRFRSNREAKRRSRRSRGSILKAAEMPGGLTRHA